VEKHGKSIKSYFFKDLFPVSILGLGLISFAFLMKKHDADFTVTVLEGVLILYAIAGYLWTTDKKISSVVAIRWSTLFYIVLSYIYAVGYKQANLLDFLLIYKSFIYIFFLTFLCNKKFMSFKGINRLTMLLFSVFFLKYAVMIILRLDPRPILFMENNFELMFLYALYLIRYSVTKHRYMPLLIFLGVITILSLSRSSLLMYSILVLFVIYDSFEKTRVFFIPGIMMLLGGVVYYIFSQRSDSLEDVDRYRFMLLWWTNVQDWNVLQWLFGAERISPLTPYTCGMMNYFSSLYSYSGDGTCYSVILHSFLLRVIYDHGILGLIFIVMSTAFMLAKSGVRKDVILVFVVIVLINGLSVSSFNNLFYAISMVFLMTTNTQFKQVTDEPEGNDDEIMELNKQLNGTRA